MVDNIRVRVGPPAPKVRVRVLPALLPLQVEFQNTGTKVQWRYIGSGDWIDLFLLSDIDTTIAVGVTTTLPFGSPATVTNSGTPSNAVFDFGIPGATAAEILTAIKTVDGTGSGLDADTLDGLDSAAFQPIDADLTAIAALTTTSYGRSLLTPADAAAARTLLGLGTSATLNTGVSAGNVPVLDGSGLLDTSILPSIAITDIFTVASQAAMLALTAQKGDIAIRSDLNKSFALSTNSPSTLADWKELLTPTDLVLAVAGLTGSISASALRTALSLVIGTDVQAFNARLADVAGASYSQGDILYYNGTNLVKLAAGTSGNFLKTLGAGANPAWAAVPGGGDMLAANSLSDVASASAARKNIGAYGDISQLIRNGSFAVAQRTMPTTDNAYCLDGWRLLLENPNGAIVAQDSINIPPGASNTARLTVGAGNNGKFGIIDIIKSKDSIPLRGGVFSVLVPMKCTAGLVDGTGKIRIGILQWTGTADNGGAAFPDPVTTWGAEGTNPTLSGSWSFANTPASIAVTTGWLDYPIENVSISASANNIAVMIWSDDRATTAATDVLYIGGYVTGAKGPVAPPPIVLPYEEELARCLFHYWSMPASTTVGLAVASNNLYSGGLIPWPAGMMFKVPAVAGTFTVNAGSAGTLAATASQYACTVGNSAANWTVNALVNVATLTADADL